VCALGLLSSALVSAQNPGPAAPPTASEPATVVDPNQRVLGVLPNYRTAQETGVYTPISSRRKLEIARKDALDYPLIYISGILAGLGQRTDSHPQFGQGVKGFAHRWGTSYADQLVGNYLSEGVFPVLFREDPRYFRLGPDRATPVHRTVYALTRIFVTKTDKGRLSFNFAEVVGNSVAAGVGNAYYPDERKFTDNLSRLSTSLATDAISQVLKEFWPDLKRKYFSRHPHGPSPPSASKTAGQ
jgi:hypothetical protein